MSDASNPTRDPLGPTSPVDLLGLSAGRSPAGRSPAGRGGNEPGSALLLFAVALLLLIVVGSLSQAYRPGPLGTALTEILAILLPALVFSRARRRHALHALRLAPMGPAALWALLGGVLLGMAWFYGLAAYIEPLWERVFPVPESERAQLLHLLRPPGGLRPLWQDLLCFAAVPALCEEVLFRGALLPLLPPAFEPLWRDGARPRYAAALPILACALLFGVFHLSLSKLFPTAVLGLGFGVAVVLSRSLWAAIAMHFANNALVVVLTRAGLDESPAAREDVPLLLLLGLFLAMLVGAGAGLRILRHAGRLTHDQADLGEEED